MDLALDNLQRLICHKTHQTKPISSRNLYFIARFIYSMMLFTNIYAILLDVYKCINVMSTVFDFYFINFLSQPTLIAFVCRTKCTFFTAINSPLFQSIMAAENGWREGRGKKKKGVKSEVLGGVVCTST